MSRTAREGGTNRQLSYRIINDIKGIGIQEIQGDLDDQC